MKTAKELQASPIVGETHQVQNVANELHSYNLFTTDAALLEGVKREGGAWGVSEIAAFGEKCGKPEYLELGFWPTNTPLSWTPMTALATGSIQCATTVLTMSS